MTVLLPPDFKNLRKGEKPVEYEIDWSHSFLRDPLALLIGGSTKEFVTGTDVVPVFDNNERIEIAKGGSGFYCGSGAKWSFTPRFPRDIFNNRNISIFAVSTIINSNNVFAGIVGTQAPSQIGLLTLGTPDDLFMTWGFTNNTGFDLVDGETAVAYGRVNTQVSNSLQGAGHNFPGRSELSAANGSAGALGFPSTWYLGGDHRQEFGRFTEQVVHLAIVVNRYVSDAEFESMARDPYQILKPKPRFGVVSAGAPSGNTLTASLNEEGDSQAAALQVINEVSASLSEEGDSSATQISVLAQLSVSLSEEGDLTSASIITSQDANITASLNESGDSQSASISLIAQIAAKLSEHGDTTAASLVTSQQANITASLSEDGDTSSASLNSLASLTAILSEEGDSQSAIIVSPITLSASLVEAGDTQVAAIGDIIVEGPSFGVFGLIQSRGKSVSGGITENGQGVTGSIVDSFGTFGVIQERGKGVTGNIDPNGQGVKGEI